MLLANVPRLALSTRVNSMRHRHSTAPPAHSYQLLWSFVLIPSQFAHPFIDRFPSFPNPRSADSAVFSKRTLFPYRADPHPVFSFLKYHPVSRAHSQPRPHRVVRQKEAKITSKGKISPRDVAIPYV